MTTLEATSEHDAARKEAVAALETLGSRVNPSHLADEAKAWAGAKAGLLKEKISPVRIAKRQMSSLRDKAVDLMPESMHSPAALPQRSTRQLDPRPAPENLDPSPQLSLPATSLRSTNSELLEDDESPSFIQNAGAVLVSRAKTLSQDGREALEVAMSARPTFSSKNQVSEPGDSVADKPGIYGVSPAVAGLVAFGGAAVLAALVTPGDKERKTLQKVQDATEPLRSQALEVGREVADSVGSVAKSRAVKIAKEHAADTLDAVISTSKGSSSTKASASATKPKRPRTA